LGGVFPVAHLIYGTVKPHIQAGTLRPLICSGDTRFAQLSQIPTLGEMGYAAPYVPINGLFAPKGTPDEVVKKISDAVRKVSENPSYRQKIENMNVAVTFETSDQYQETLKGYRKSIGEFFTKFGWVKK
jgi:tripartite-type tricarboxylate transporter receptor subunit TctC